ncbi:MAG: GatB/YqeY domain-containing protein [Gammaproteobacteria bacterium]|nr:GatB/YqeY domain-containing protein [Gammaproteobacteria bacterium]MBU1645825.1 GatB/YqeY domain-containing protein [Gammaproteobacteria bacterium]MBU1971887.1 GatB/YqeY domain-containing protein [Gammaproteobacteria bacterium]
MSLKIRINEDMKTAMKAKDSTRLAAIRLLMAAMKQREVDERIELDDTAVIAVIEKMLKQRKDSITQYEAANRQDLADVEKFEVVVLQTYMPQAMSAAEVEALVVRALTDSGAKAPADMGKVMALVKPQVAGRADMGEVSKLIKAKLTPA